MIPIVLSVDDDTITQMLNQMIFKRTGFSAQVIAFNNGKEALLFFEQLANDGIDSTKLPALIFLDLNMPVTDGWEFLESFSKDYAFNFPAVKVVILSSTINPDEKQKAYKYDRVIDFLCKPLTLQMIELLKQHPAMQQYFIA